jgi:hypothetical protein
MMPRDDDEREPDRIGLWTHAQLLNMDARFCRAMAVALGQPPPPPSPYRQLRQMLDTFQRREYTRRQAARREEGKHDAA